MANYVIPTYPIRRLRYYNNQFLNDQDFIDDQAYEIAVTQALLRALCVAGVCEGLTVRIDGTGKLQVAAGTAIDSAGHLIVLDAEKAGPTASTLADGPYLLHISFHEDEDVMAPPVAGGAQGNTRWTQHPGLGATPSGGAIPAGAIVLGTFTVLTAAVSAITTTGRQYSGIRFPGPNATVAATATNRNDGSADGVLLGGDMTMRRDVPGGLIGPTLTLMNGVAFPGGVSSGAAIDFDGYNPGANAPALRLQALSDNAGSSHLAISTKQPGAITNTLVERLRITNLGTLQFPSEVKDRLVVTTNYGLGWNTNNLALFCPPAGHLSLRQNSSTGAEVFTVSGTGAATFAGTASFSSTVSVTGNLTVNASVSASALSVQNATLTGALSVAGASTLAGLTAQSATIIGGLSVAGFSDLASLSTIRQQALGGSKALILDSAASGNLASHLRIYADFESIWFTLNASWNGTAWARDSTGLLAGGFRFSRYQFEFLHENSMAATFTTWSRTWLLNMINTPNSSFELTGSVTETGRVGLEWSNADAATRNLGLGGSVTFRNRFPATPSSITFSSVSTSAFTGNPSTWFPDRDGFGYFSFQNVASLGTTYWYGTYTAIA